MDKTVSFVGGATPRRSTLSLAAVTVVLSAYAPVVSSLEPVLNNLPPRVVGIDGRNGAGKTTLGRYLSWRFNITLVESDLFATDGSVIRGYRLDEIDRIIQLRLDKPRPVLIEGVALLRLFDQLQRRPDFLIYCDSHNQDSDDLLGPWLDDYAQSYDPKSRADIVAELHAHRS